MDADQWQPMRGPFTRWPRISDAILAFVSFFLTLAIWWSDQAEENYSLPFIAFVLFAIGNAVLYLRRLHPELVHAIILAVSALVMMLAHLPSAIFALAISLYNLGRYTANTRNSTIGIVATYVLMIVSELAFSGLSSDDFPSLLMPFAIWYTGRRVRARGEYLRLLQERADHLEREQIAESNKAVAAERTRIARELHDIVAHQVSLMTVQAGAAKTIVDSDPKAAAGAMDSVEVAGRQALDELRHLLGVLRPDRDSDDLGPQPGRADLPKLIEEMSRAGLDVSLDLGDSLQTLPARIELAIYRIVQEGLTNVLKHAGPDSNAEVSVHTGEREVTIEIMDNGTGTSAGAGSGHGVPGMRERAQLLGGTFAAGPRANGGFLVQARLPISEEIA